MTKKNYFYLTKFASNIKRLRKDLDLNQEDIASYLGVTRSFYSGIEAGKYSLSINNFIGLYYFFREKGLPVTSDFLLGLSEKYGHSMEQENLRLKKEIEDLKKDLNHYVEQTNNLKEIIALLKSTK